MNEKQRYWERHHEAWKQSGLSQAVYCKKHDLRSTTFSGWHKKLNLRDSSGEFVEVGVLKPIELQIGEMILRIPSGFDVTEVRRLIEVLRC